MRRSNATLNAYDNGTPKVEAFNVEALIVEALNDGTFNVEALNVEALNDGTLIDETFNDRALDVYTLFLFQFIKNFASQVALGGSKFAYLCGHITRKFFIHPTRWLRGLALRTDSEG